ncbi:nitrate- and nitrite sensing domain-containing protein, partial [Streptomyces sp. B1866]|uniref:sensor histidine kinase n=1 Tax=Streptomyces sp. B1866 TaxID=3075431 RepID=UPI00288DD8E4
MRFRGKSIRRKIVALLLVPLVCLTAIWVFATVITGREAMRLLDASDVIDRAGAPAEDAVHAIQQERRQTLVLLADPGGTGALPALRTAQHRTDKVLARLRDASSDGGIRGMMTGDSRTQLARILRAADGLEGLRGKVERRAATSPEAYQYYNQLVDLCYNFRSSLHAVPDPELDRQGRALVAMIRAREALSREENLFVAAATARRITPADMRAISDLIAERNVLYAINLPTLPPREQRFFTDYRYRTPHPEALRAAEERLFRAGAERALREVDLRRWEGATQPVLADYDRLGGEATVRLQHRIDPVATDVMVKAGVAGILGLLCLLLSVFVSFRVGRDLIRDLGRLRRDAQEASHERLPDVMRRLAAGERLDPEAEAPRGAYGGDEIGQVAEALNTLQRAAVEAAVKQAELRHGVSEVFVNLARRSQVLLHRQLTLLDAMERRTEDTDELADLFRLDHMTTRMRRHAEGLVILSGAAPSRQWRKPIRLMDVVRGAVAEVEDYERVEVRRLPPLAVAGPAVADLTHLVAELLENATVFSPPHTAVQVVGERVASGFTLEIHDRGLGMAPEVLKEANQRLAETPEFELSDTDRLGLFVVSRLAQRQGVRVSLQPSPYGGTTAVVLIPAALLTEPEDGGRDEPPTAGEDAERDSAAVFPDRAARNSSRLRRTAPQAPSWAASPADGPRAAHAAAGGADGGTEDAGGGLDGAAYGDGDGYGADRAEARDDGPEDRPEDGLEDEEAGGIFRARGLGGPRPAPAAET